MAAKKIEDAARFLHDTGLLFEINRRILHPLGLALEIAQEEDGVMYVSGVWDCRDDPEGVIFEEETFEFGESKLNRYMEEQGNAFMIKRAEKLGFLEQEDAKVETSA